MPFDQDMKGEEINLAIPYEDVCVEVVGALWGVPFDQCRAVLKFVNALIDIQEFAQQKEPPCPLHPEENALTFEVEARRHNLQQTVREGLDGK